MEEDRMLIVFGGLPGTGKTTIARPLAAQLGAMYLRIDIIEQALRNADVLAWDVGTAGYGVANALALSNLDNGNAVVADGVHPVAECRQAWRSIAVQTSVRLIEVEVVCSNRREHRRREESRSPDISGLPLPTWQSVVERTYEPWSEPHLVIDTAAIDAKGAVDFLLQQLHSRVLSPSAGTPNGDKDGNVQITR